MSQAVANLAMAAKKESEDAQKAVAALAEQVSQLTARIEKLEERGQNRISLPHK